MLRAAAAMAVASLNKLLLLLLLQATPAAHAERLAAPSQLMLVHCLSVLLQACCPQCVVVTMRAPGHRHVTTCPARVFTHASLQCPIRMLDADGCCY